MSGCWKTGHLLREAETFKEMVGGLAGEQVPGSGTEVYSPVGVGLETGEMTV